MSAPRFTAQQVREMADSYRGAYQHIAGDTLAPAEMLDALAARLEAEEARQRNEDKQCGTPERKGFSYVCSLPKDHDGPHIAQGFEGRVLHSWAQRATAGGQG